MSEPCIEFKLISELCVGFVHHSRTRIHRAFDRVLFTCFYRLHQLFGDYSRGEIFTRDSVGQLRQFGVACLLWGVVNFLWDGLWFGILANPTRSFQGHFEAFGIGAILIVIAWFMDMAVDLREENELTI